MTPNLGGRARFESQVLWFLAQCPMMCPAAPQHLWNTFHSISAPLTLPMYRHLYLTYRQGSLYRWIILYSFTNLSYIPHSKQCKYLKYFIWNAICLFFSFRNIQNVTHFPFLFWKGILSCLQRKRQRYWNFHKESFSPECSCRHLCWRDVNISSILLEIYPHCCLMLQLPMFASPPRNPTAHIRKPGLNI